MATSGKFGSPMKEAHVLITFSTGQDYIGGNSLLHFGESLTTHTTATFPVHLLICKVDSAVS